MARIGVPLGAAKSRPWWEDDQWSPLWANRAVRLYDSSGSTQPLAVERSPEERDERSPELSRDELSDVDEPDDPEDLGAAGARPLRRNRSFGKIRFGSSPTTDRLSRH